MRKRLLLLAACGVGGALFGLIVSSIPSPSDPTVFWAGNFSSPWAVLAFLAGWSQRSWVWAACAGAGADLASVMGFYGQFLTLDPMRMGLPRSTNLVTVAATSLTGWFEFIAPWLVIALGAGVICGVLGRWWGRSRALIAGLAIAAPFIAEPWVWPIYNGYYKGPIVVWVAEVAVGLLVIVGAVTSWRRARRSPMPWIP